MLQLFLICTGTPDTISLHINVHIFFDNEIPQLIYLHLLPTYLCIFETESSSGCPGLLNPLASAKCWDLGHPTIPDYVSFSSSVL